MNIELVETTEAGATLVIGAERIALTAAQIREIENVCWIYNYERSEMLSGRYDAEFEQATLEADAAVRGLGAAINESFARVFGGAR